MKKYHLVFLSAMLLLLSGCASVTSDIRVGAEPAPGATHHKPQHRAGRATWASNLVDAFGRPSLSRRHALQHAGKYQDMSIFRSSASGQALAEQATGYLSGHGQGNRHESGPGRLSEPYFEYDNKRYGEMNGDEPQRAEPGKGIKKTA